MMKKSILLKEFGSDYDFSFGFTKKGSLDVILRAGKYTHSNGNVYAGKVNTMEGDEIVDIGSVFLPDGTPFPDSAYPNLSSFYTLNGVLYLILDLEHTNDSSLSGKYCSADLFLTSQNIFNKEHFVCMPCSIQYVEASNKFLPYIQIPCVPGVLGRDVANKNIYVTMYDSEKDSNNNYTYTVLDSYLWDGSPDIHHVVDSEYKSFYFSNDKIDKGSYASLPNLYKYPRPKVELQEGTDYLLHLEYFYGFV